MGVGADHAAEQDQMINVTNAQITVTLLMNVAMEVAEDADAIHDPEVEAEGEDHTADPDPDHHAAAETHDPETETNTAAAGEVYILLFRS